MDFLIVAAVAAFASALTLYSGFGLGTVLLPVFLWLFPLPVAIAATGVVHLLNNVFKGGLLWRDADWPTVVRFGLPAVPGAVVGAWLLGRLGDTPRLFTWAAGDRVFGPTAAGVVVGVLMIGLALLELQPWFQRLGAPPRLMPVGGVATGLLGGLTGQQGALRTVFLLRAGLTPPRFIATGVVVAVLVDVARLPGYASAILARGGELGRHGWWLVACATLAAFAGALVAVRTIRKVTVGTIRAVVATVLIGVGGALAVGVLGS